MDDWPAGLLALDCPTGFAIPVPLGALVAAPTVLVVVTVKVAVTVDVVVVCTPLMKVTPTFVEIEMST